MTIPRHVTLSALFTGFAIGAWGQGQPGDMVRIPILDPAAENRLLDAAFPKGPPMPGARYTILLRFLPSLHAESQIEVHVAADSRVFVEYQRATVQLRQVFEDLARIGPVNEQEVALRMKVVKTSTILDSPAAFSLLESFWGALGQSCRGLAERAKRQRTQLDGTTYQLSYDRGRTVELLTFSFEDAEIDSASVPELAIVTWMNDLRKRAHR